MYKKDIQLYKQNNYKSAQIFKCFERNIARKYKQIMAKIKKQKIQFKIQLVTMEKKKQMVLLLNNKDDED